MNSSTQAVPLNDGRNQLWLYVIYIFQGAMISSCNLLAVAAIWRQEALRSRNEYIIISAKAFGDTLVGFGYLIGGFYYVLLVFTERHHLSVPVSECLWFSHQVLFSVSAPLTQIMEMVIAGDRLYSVALPEYYTGMSESYGKALTGTVISICFILGFPAPLIMSHLVEPVNSHISIKCRAAVVQASVHEFFGVWYSYVGTSFCFFSIFFYIPVVIFYKRVHIQAGGSHDRQRTQRIKRQRKLTKSLVISALVTFCVLIVPAQVALALLKKGWVAMATVFFVFANIDPIFNVVILLKRHKEIRLKFLLCEYVINENLERHRQPCSVVTLCHQSWICGPIRWHPAAKEPISDTGDRTTARAPISL